MKTKPIKVKYTSVWDNNAEITTDAEYDPETGEVTAETSDSDPGNDACLEREYIELPDGDEIDVCATCHSYTMHGVMNPGQGHDLNEEQECRDPDCESHG